MTRTLSITTITAAVLLGVGLYHGRATDRWADPSADDSPGRRFADMPLALGDWVGEPMPRESTDDPKTSVQNFKFTQPRTGRWVLTSITSGRAGRVSIHNPEHCYLGSGYEVVDAIKRESLDADKKAATAFWTGHFQKKKPTGVESIRIWWGWSGDGNWQAPEYPRLYYAAAQRLHKLYMIHPVTGRDTPEDQAAYREFMLRYLAEMNRRVAG